MQFKIKSTSIKISFSFLVIFLIFALTDNLDIYIKTLSASLIHETVHIIFIIAFKGSVSKITFNILGGKIEKSNKIMLGNNKEAVINLSAPIFNIIIGLISLLFNQNIQWVYINLFIGIFNLLPFYNFDGGQGLFFFLCNRIDLKTAKNVIKILSFIACVSFSLFSAYIFFYVNKNYIFIIFSFYMLFSLLFQ